MGAFHSGTDLSELEDNAGVYNYYVSLVVNFKETYVCKIAFPATVIINETKHNVSTIRNTDGTIIPFEEKSEKNEERVIHYLGDLDVVIESTPIEISEWIEDRYAEVKKAKEKPVYVPYTSYYDTFKADRSVIGFRKEEGGAKLPIPTYRQQALGGDFQREDSVLEFEEYTAASFTTAREVSRDPSKTIKLFVNAVVFSDSTVPLDIIKGVVNLNLLPDAEFQLYLDLLEANIEILHDNIYGLGNVHLLRHLKEVVVHLSAYKNTKRVGHIDKLIEFLDDYGTPAT